ncbi:MmcQ/YjbR family DNA-binding protein [Kitasatospora sp. NPDC008050]|uniref:MmcQ/YjbR family DNA-binding protein n=1 Tax=Kitasatospora sp. NPDC008050 TaxID=3364021 RepID=UPI0036E0898C
MATVEQVRAAALALPRTSEHLIRDRVKFRVGRIVYLALSSDETVLGFAFPREERELLLATEPGLYLPPEPADERFNWLQLRLAAVSEAELGEIVLDAWRMVVPKRVAAEHEAARSDALPPGPSLAQLRFAAGVFAGLGAVDAGWERWAAATAAGPDLARPEHREALHRWLNSWGCRIRYPREGEPDLFSAALDVWWAAHGTALPAAGATLANLTDRQLDALATAYAELAALRVSPSRTLGPTAAAKALYALRPAAVMPWDAAIAKRLHGSRDGAAFRRHLTCGRQWARAVIAESGSDEGELPRELGRAAVPLAKVLDDYLYVTITAGIPAAP